MKPTVCRQCGERFERAAPGNCNICFACGDSVDFGTDKQNKKLIEQQPMKPERLTKEQAAIIGAYTGILAGDFSDLHKYIERLLGRPVYTHEMVREVVMEEIKNKSREDFMSILPL